MKTKYDAIYVKREETTLRRVEQNVSIHQKNVGF